MENNQGYVIRQSVLFDNGRGFAMGENFKAPNPFVTWQFTQEGGKRDYYWGHYFNEECEAIGDYNRRVFSYEKQYGVSRLETSGPDFFKYYSTQRPVDIATYPRPKDNLPVAHLNYNTRQPVEGESFRAWGELWYLHPPYGARMIIAELFPDEADVFFLTEFRKVGYRPFVHTCGITSCILLHRPVCKLDVFLALDDFHQMIEHLALDTVRIQSVKDFLHSVIL